MRGCLTLLIGILLGVILGVAGFGGFQTLVVQPTPAPSPTSATSDITIELQDQFLTREVKGGTASLGSGLSLENPTIRTQAGQTLLLDGNFVLTTVLGRIQAQSRVQFRPIVQQDRIALQVLQAQVGGISVPASLFQSLDTQLNNQITLLFGSTSYRVVSVSTTANSLLVGIVVDQ